MDAIASGIVPIEVPALIEVGITAGYISEDENDRAVGLTPKGRACYTHDLERRG